MCAGKPDVDGDGSVDGGIDACQGDSGKYQYSRNSLKLFQKYSRNILEIFQKYSRNILEIFWEYSRNNVKKYREP